MAEEKISPEPGDSKRFKVRISERALPDFPDQKDVDIILPDEASARRYEVFRKDIPRAARGKQFNGRTIKWFNNFGLKENGAYVPRVESGYLVQMDKIEGAVYVFFDGSNPQRLSTEPVPGDSGKVQATLYLGDPAVGWG